MGYLNAIRMAGIIAAFFCSVLAEFLNQFISPYFIVNVLIYCLLVVPSLLLGPGTIVIWGLIIVIIANIVIFTIFTAIGYDLFKNLTFSISNIIFNYFLFTYLAEPLLMLMML